MNIEQIQDFISFAKKLEGYEKGEGQTFLNRFVRVFGYQDVYDAGGIFEDRIKIENATKFSDMIIAKKLLVEMKSRGENLENHWKQAKNYWDESYEKRTKYVILCNFDEFWIYDWNIQKDPLDKISLEELWQNPKRWEAFNFLSKEEVKPRFRNNLEEITREVANNLVFVYNSLVKRKEIIKLTKEQIQRYVLQCLIALFAEDVGLFPKQDFFNNIIQECIDGASSYDLFQNLFEHMNNPKPAIGGKFKDVQYFNGGLFKEINPIELNKDELVALKEASDKDWSKVQPYILGTIFENSMEKEDRHAYGAHFTYESDIMKIVEPTILRPFRNKLKKAKKLEELKNILRELANFKVLDPACGSGNFLYISYRELKHFEIEVLQKILDEYPSQNKKDSFISGIIGRNFYGIDNNPFAVELAKVTMSIAKKYAADDFNEFKTKNQKSLGLNYDSPLPFDNMDENIVCKDAILNDWPRANVIIGNPPYITYNDMNSELGADYTEQIREAYPDIPGRADYCVWWFRKAHDYLENGNRAGLVGTNTISQNYSRIGGLDYIINNGGIIFDAVSSKVWSGDAAVYVSIVNWQKGNGGIKNKKLYCPKEEKKDSDYDLYELDYISSLLKPICDVSKAKDLKKTNDNEISGSKTCYQGQTHGQEGFLISKDEYKQIIKNNPINKEILFPYLIADELIGSTSSLPQRYSIDFTGKDIYEIQKYKECFRIVQEKVFPIIKENAEKEIEKNKHQKKQENARQNKLNTWWLFWRSREELISKINNAKRYIACGRHTKRPIFEFISNSIRPNDALTVFTLADDYSFGILSSQLHSEWYSARSSTIKGDSRYTNTTAYNSFIWPQF